MKLKRIAMKCFILLFSLIICVFCAVGCIYTGYKGDYPQLCSVAWANLVASLGSGTAGEPIFDPYVHVLENDKYGRVLFSYYEEGRDVGTHLLIMQKSNDENAYYYPEDCYLFVSFELVETMEIDLNTEEVLAFKALNDWDLPLNESKCDSTKIVSKKPEGSVSFGSNEFSSALKAGYQNSDLYMHPRNLPPIARYNIFIVADNYGRELYSVLNYYVDYSEKSETGYYYYFLVVRLPDGSCDESTVILLKDIKNPQNDVKKIKAENGWNTPFN